MRKEDFARWLRRYGDAWEKRDAKAAIALFTEDAEYYWVPFGEPIRGHGGIEGAWNGATAEQRDIRFSFEILAAPGNSGIARWHTKLVRPATGALVELDGMLVAEFDDSRRCRAFREWWHSTESA
jgi:ketosteroid isomerase-like protein